MVPLAIVPRVPMVLPARQVLLANRVHPARPAPRVRPAKTALPESLANPVLVAALAAVVQVVVVAVAVRMARTVFPESWADQAPLDDLVLQASPAPRVREATVVPLVIVVPPARLVHVAGQVLVVRLALSELRVVVDLVVCQALLVRLDQLANVVRLASAAPVARLVRPVTVVHKVGLVSHLSKLEFTAQLVIRRRTHKFHAVGANAVVGLLEYSSAEIPETWPLISSHKCSSNHGAFANVECQCSRFIGRVTIRHLIAI